MPDLPRFTDMLAGPGLPPKRLAPKRRDARLPTRTDRSPTMGKYSPALDAAPQDGRWLDDPATVTTVLQFLLSKLSPADLAELDTHLAKGTTPQATDHRLPDGDLQRDLLNYSPRNRQQMLASLNGTGAHARGAMSLDAMLKADPDHGKSLLERFPDMARLRG